MSKNLKPVSDFERGLLAALGETPAQHQTQMKDRLFGAKVGSANDTKRTLAELNRMFERKRNATMHEPVADIARRLEAREAEPMPVPRAPASIDEAIERGWKLEAHVLFIHEFHCACGHVCVGLDMARPALCLSKPMEPGTKMYFPTSVTAHSGLPRIRDVRMEQVSHCHNCFTGDTHGKTETSPQA